MPSEATGSIEHGSKRGSGTVLLEEIRKSIRHAQAKMTETDLAPEFSRTKRGMLRAPKYYGRLKPPLEFDAEQGWEVPTDQGELLELAIRQVGCGVDELAKTRREASTLSLTQIYNTEKELHERLKAVVGGSTPAPGTTLHEVFTKLNFEPSVFSSQTAYNEDLATLRDAIQDKLDRNSKLRVGDNKPNVFDFGEQDAHERYLKFLGLQEGYLSAWELNENRLDSESRMSALSEIRMMGGEYDQRFLRRDPVVKRILPWKKTAEPLNLRDEQARRAVASTAKILPNDWVVRLGECYLEVRGYCNSSWHLKQKTRCKRFAPRLRLSPPTWLFDGPMTRTERDALHEIGHHLEHVYPEINQIARTYKAVRTTERTTTKKYLLHEIESSIDFPGNLKSEGPPPCRMDKWDGDGSWFRPRPFGVPYAGKETPPWASEVFSTGLEAALVGRFGSTGGGGGRTADPQHLHLILGILATVGRQKSQ